MNPLGAAGRPEVELNHQIVSGIETPGEPIRREGGRLSGRPAQEVTVRIVRGMQHHALVAWGGIPFVEPSRCRRGIDADVRVVNRGMAEHLHKWVGDGPYAPLFDNVEDNLTLARFQCFDFEGMNRYPGLIEPLLFYILHRANASIYDPEASTTFKTFFIDEAWRFFSHPTIRNYIVEALKTWRKKNAAMILSTQSLDELDKSHIVNVVIESCATKIFLANPDMDREWYRNTFHLNDNEIEMISTLVPKRQALVKRPDLTKVVNLEVDEKSYWLYTSDPNDSFKREQAFREHGFEKGLEVLTRSSL